MTWPTLTAEQAEHFERTIADAGAALSLIPDRITHYPGGGIPATQIRDALKLLAQAGGEINSMHPDT